MSLSREYIVRGCTSEKELLEVVDLLDRAFPNTPREYFERHILNDPTLKPEHTRVVEFKGSIISSVQVFPRVMNLGAADAQFGGIGNVATDPAQRRGGLASVPDAGRHHVDDRPGLHLFTPWNEHQPVL